MSGISCFNAAVFLECVSQWPLFNAPLTRTQLTRHNGTPASTSRRASNTLWPKRLPTVAVADLCRLPVEVKRLSRLRRAEQDRRPAEFGRPGESSTPLD